MAKRRINIKLDEEMIDYIEECKEEAGVHYTGDMVSRLLKEHQKQQAQGQTMEQLLQVAAGQFRQVFASELKKLQLGVNNSDRNTQMLIELMNGMFMDQGVDHLMTTSNFESKPVAIAREEVKERIAHQRQKKIDWEESQQAKQGEM